LQRPLFGWSQHVNEALLVGDMPLERSVDQVHARWRETYGPASSVLLVGFTGDQAGRDQSVDAFGHSAGGDHRRGGQFGGGERERLASTPQRCQYVELAIADPELWIDEVELGVQGVGEPVEPSDDALTAVAPIAWGFIAHESFGPGQLIGMLLVFSGIAAGQPSVSFWLQQFRASRSAHRRDTVGIWDPGEPPRPQVPATHRGA
jgi:hypothetical protein